MGEQDLENQVSVNNLVQAPFLPEPVRVLTFEPLNEQTFRLEGVGAHSEQFYSRLLTREQAKQLQPIREIWDFGGKAEAVFLSLEAHRIRSAYLFDPLHAVHVSQIDPLPHQIDAVYHSILPQPRIRFLLGDDPGAGKTIMAGLVLRELKLRGIVHRTLVVVPGHLQDQWLREMKERFGESFQTVNREVVNSAWGRNIWRELPQAITSMDFAKQEDVMASMKEAEWDLVIVDEAHKMAAYQYGEKVSKTQRYRLGEALSKRTRFLLFLTATPHKGDPENFRLLLDLLELNFFASTKLMEQAVQSGDNPLFLRRLKEELRDFEGRPLFPPRHVHTLRYRLTDKERALYNAVTRYVSEHMDKALKANRRNVAFAMLVLQRRLASSVHALRDSLERRKRRLSELHKLGKWLEEVGEIDWDALDDAPELERLKQEEELVEKLTNAQTLQELQQEITVLDELIRLARELEREGIETKLQELRSVVKNQRLRQTGEKLLIFTESVRTMEYLASKLREWHFTVTTLHGGMNLDQRIQAEHDFEHKTQVMVSTEAGGEGINLQFCSLMVNYDIPWSFVRLEQRMGRIHRYGQRREVHIYNLVTEDTVEGKVLTRLFERLERARAELGSDRVYDVIGEVISDRRLEELILEALAQQRTLEDIIAEIDAVPDEEVIRRAQEAMLQALATHHIDIQRIVGEQAEARENRLVPEYIKAFFERACRFMRVSAQRRADNPNLWRVERVPLELRSQSSEFKNRFGEVFGEYLKVAFDKDTAKRERAEFVAPGHPLLEAIVERLFGQEAKDLRRGAVFGSPTGQEGILWFLEGEVVDGSGTVAGKKLIALFQDQQGNFRVTDPAILWDLLPMDSPSEKTIVLDEGQVRQALAHAFQEVLEPYRQQLLHERQRQADIKHKYGVESLRFLIAESENKLADYEAREVKGEDVRLPLQQEQRRHEELSHRLAQLKRQIEQETQLLVSEPKLLTVVRVMPMPVQAGEDSEEADPKVEAIGMQVAMKYERVQGRFPEDVSLRKCGYDIRSRAPDDSFRYIEVKARARTGSIALTPNEWLMAHRLGDNYWLYIVTDAKTDAPQLSIVHNPVAKLHPKEKVVRFVVSDWQQNAERAEV